MVVLSVVSAKNHARSFPFVGFLGLTPVIIEGTVRTTLEEDLKPIKTAQILVRLRCYQEDTTGSKPKKFVLKEVVQEIWKAENGEWGMIGDFARPFKLVLPIDYGACGGTTVYKDLKMYWKVEAVLYHKVIPMQGCRKIASHLVPLVDFSLPNVTLPIPSWSSPTNLGSRGLHYKINCSPTRGPDEVFQILVDLKKDDLNLSVKKIQFSLDRTITILGNNNSAGAISSSDCDDSILCDEEEEERIGRSPKKKVNLFKRSASNPSSPIASTSLSSPEPETRHSGGGRTTNNIFLVEKLDLLFDGNGLSSSSIETIVPRQKSLYKYSYGESVRTKFAVVEFALTIKIFFKTKNNGSGTIELEPRTIKMMASSAEERNQATLTAHKSLLRADEASLYQDSMLSKASSISPPSTPIIHSPHQIIVLAKSNRRVVRRDELGSADGSRKRGDLCEPSPRRSKPRSEKSGDVTTSIHFAPVLTCGSASSPELQAPTTDSIRSAGRFPLASSQSESLSNLSNRRSPRTRIGRRPYSAASRPKSSGGFSTHSKRSFEESDSGITRRLRLDPESSPPPPSRPLYSTPPPVSERDSDGDINFMSFGLAPSPILSSNSTPYYAPSPSETTLPPPSPPSLFQSFSLSRSTSSTFHSREGDYEIDPLDNTESSWTQAVTTQPIVTQTLPPRATTSAGTTTSFGSYSLSFDHTRSQTISPSATPITFFSDLNSVPKVNGRRKSSLVALLRSSTSQVIKEIHSPASPTTPNSDSRWSFLKRSGKT